MCSFLFAFRSNYGVTFLENWASRRTTTSLTTTISYRLIGLYDVIGNTLFCDYYGTMRDNTLCDEHLLCHPATVGDLPLHFLASVSIIVFEIFDVE